MNFLLEKNFQSRIQDSELLQEPDFQLSTDPDTTLIAEDSSEIAPDDVGDDKPVYEYSDYYLDGTYEVPYGEVADKELPGELE